MTVKIINLTPHDINIILDNDTTTIPTSGQIARCKTNRIQIDMIDSIPINQTQFGQVTDLPNQQENIFYIVSALVANALPDRSDLLIPDDTVRDNEGKIIGCKALARV